MSDYKGKSKKPSADGLELHQYDLLMWAVLCATSQDYSFDDPVLVDAMGFGDASYFNTWREQVSTDIKTDNVGLNTVVESLSQNKVKFEVLASHRGILDLIKEHESDGNYDIAWGGEEPIIDGKRLTECTLNEVLDWQESCGKRSTAVGAYQFINKTLSGLKDRFNLTGDEMFNESLQDKLGTELANRRGLNKYLNGEISEQKLANNLAKEWASLQNSSGKGHYDGDGLNTARAGYGDVVSALRHDFNENKTGMNVADSGHEKGAELDVNHKPIAPSFDV